jgi:hypothetical protein
LQVCARAASKGMERLLERILPRAERVEAEGKVDRWRVGGGTYYRSSWRDP